MVVLLAVTAILVLWAHKITLEIEVLEWAERSEDHVPST
jgi:hypothetical protein